MRHTPTGYRGYRFGEAIALSARQRDVLIAAFQNAAGAPQEILGGRQSVERIELPGVGPVVVKAYIRGGVIRHFNRQTHLKWGSPRCAREMNWLQKVHELNVCAPTPVAWADSGGRLLYRCWLVTRTIPETQSLAQVSIQNLDRTAAVFPEICRQLTILIKNRIHHKDLHPGNILIDDHDRAFFLDFDKAARHHGSGPKLAATYLRRWRRAVAKYGLPSELDRYMTEDLNGRWQP